MFVPSFGAIGASIVTAISYIVFFTLRSLISLKYYQVNYGLKKIYIMLIVISSYAIISLINKEVSLNILVGLASVFILIIIYYNDLIKNNKLFKGSFKKFV